MLCVVENFAKALKVRQGHSKLNRCVSPYYYSIVTMSLSCTISVILNVE